MQDQCSKKTSNPNNKLSLKETLLKENCITTRPYFPVKTQAYNIRTHPHIFHFEKIIY